MCCTRLTGLKSGVMFCLSLIEVYWIAVAKKKIFADLGKRMAVFLWGNGKHCKGKPRPKIILRQTGNQSQEIEKSFGAELFSNLSRVVRVVVRRVFFRFGDFGVKRLFRLEQSGVIYRFFFFFRDFCGFFRRAFGEVDSHLAADVGFQGIPSALGRPHEMRRRFAGLCP